MNKFPFVIIDRDHLSNLAGTLITMSQTDDGVQLLGVLSKGLNESVVLTFLSLEEAMECAPDGTIFVDLSHDEENVAELYRAGKIFVSFGTHANFTISRDAAQAPYIRADDFSFERVVRSSLFGVGLASYPGFQERYPSPSQFYSLNGRVDDRECAAGLLAAIKFLGEVNEVSDLYSLRATGRHFTMDDVYAHTTSEGIAKLLEQLESHA